MTYHYIEPHPKKRNFLVLTLVAANFVMLLWLCSAFKKFEDNVMVYRGGSAQDALKYPESYDER